MPSDPVSVDALIFPEASHNFSQVLSSLKRSKHSIKHRLASIYADSKFVESVADHYGLPLVGNERCGSWYIPPERKIGSVYFKSTDGHHGQWLFNTRRLNLQLLDIVEKHQGCIITDSTRRGKLLPDALSKTIPIWLATLNTLLFPSLPDSHALRTHPACVSASEHAQIAAKLPSFVQTLNSLLSSSPSNDDNHLTHLRRRIRKPMRAVFVAPTLGLPSTQAEDCDGYHPIILLAASQPERDDADTGYIQGAGDDTEMWAHGLTSSAFWRRRETLMADEGEEELRRRIGVVMHEEAARAQEAAAARGGAGFTRVYGAAAAAVEEGGVYVGATGAWDGRGVREVGGEGWDAVVVCSDGDGGDVDVGGEGGSEGGGGKCGKGGDDGNGDNGISTPRSSNFTSSAAISAANNDPSAEAEAETAANPKTAEKSTPSTHTLHLRCPPGKLGSRALRTQLPSLLPFLQQLRADQGQPRILILCPTGTDLALGVALAVVCLRYDDEGTFAPQPRTAAVDKAFVRQRLVALLNRVPGANPARATLQAVNAFLMERPG